MWQSPAVIRQAHHTPHALCMPANSALASDKIDVPAGCMHDVICNEAVPFRLYCGGAVTRMQNVSEYMLVLAPCLVVLVIQLFNILFPPSLMCALPIKTSPRLFDICVLQHFAFLFQFLVQTFSYIEDPFSLSCVTVLILHNGLSTNYF